MKKTLLILTLIMSTSYAKPIAPKMGCILAQQGEVSVHWTLYGDTLRGIESNSTQVDYVPIQKEGTNFNEILVGSIIKSTFQNKPFSAKLIHLQSKKRIGRGPRHGLIVVSLTLNNITKYIPMVYVYKKGDMQMKTHINLKTFKLSNKDTYAELAMGLQVHSVVCTVPDRTIIKK